MFVEHADQLGERLGVVRVAKNEAIYPIVQRCPAVEWSITRFPMWAAVLNYRGSARGLRFTVSLRNGAVLLGGAKFFHR